MVSRTLISLLLAALLLPAGAHAAADDLTVTRRDQLSPRLLELGFTTAALPAETNVRVLLPDGYAAEPQRRWPVLYLLHGCCDFDVDGSRAWTTHGRVEEITAGRPLIVVMPAGGRGGMYSNWLTAGSSGRPQWERYHLDQLVPWVDRELRTVASREGRAIAGLSMGGFGATKYAAVHPDRFVFAASFSGIVDSNTDAGVVHGALPGLDGGSPASVWGPRTTDELRWRSQNPWDLAENLAALRYDLRTGDGDRGPLDDGSGPPDVVEQAAARSTASLHARLEELGVAHAYDAYGPGTHTWPYWARSLERTVPRMLETFASPPPAPTSVTYRSAQPRYAVFGWDVRFARDGLGFSRLVAAGPDGFTLEGEGAARVTSPPVYRPGSTARVTVGDAAVRDVAVDGDGRVTVATAGPAARVRIAAPARRCTSRRVVRLTVPAGLRRVVVRVDGRRVPVRGRRAVVDLRGRDAGTARVVMTGRTRGGRAVRTVRRFRTCTARA